MCLDSDLFGDIIVTYDDVELWLRSIPRLNDDARANHVQDYINNYGVVCKIKASKLDKSFYCLNQDCCNDSFNLSNSIESTFKPKFKTLPIIPLSMMKRRERLDAKKPAF